MLTVNNLRFAWPGNSRAVLDIPSLELADGETLFLHGGSGSGKSTLLAAIAGVVAIDPGCLRVAGTDLGTLHGPARDRFRPSTTCCCRAVSRGRGASGRRRAPAGCTARP
jgi:putative ABC transport system ATP-binding protein